MQTQQVVFFKEMGEQRSNMVEEAVQTSTMERLCNLHYIPVQGSWLVSNTRLDKTMFTWENSSAIGPACCHWTQQ
jgi:hypothetical protein